MCDWVGLGITEEAKAMEKPSVPTNWFWGLYTDCPSCRQEGHRTPWELVRNAEAWGVLQTL